VVEAKEVKRGIFEFGGVVNKCRWSDKSVWYQMDLVMGIKKGGRKEGL